MMYKAFLVKYAEIGIKGKNRHLFEKALCVNLERKYIGFEIDQRQVDFANNELKNMSRQLSLF